MKLILMTDFVFGQKERKDIDLAQRFINSFNYANFLKQPLTLEMFIPCDENGDVLEKEPNEDELCKFCDYPSDKRHANAHSLGCEGSSCESTAENYLYVYQ